MCVNLNQGIISLKEGRFNQFNHIITSLNLVSQLDGMIISCFVEYILFVGPAIMEQDFGLYAFEFLYFRGF